jgi:hypothetical protein
LLPLALIVRSFKCVVGREETIDTISQDPCRRRVVFSEGHTSFGAIAAHPMSIFAVLQSPMVDVPVHIAEDPRQAPEDR